MALWPFRSRPVVTPFNDDFSARVFSFENTYAANAFTESIPDNLYIMPSSITIPVDAAAGIRGTTAGRLLISRGGLTFAGVTFGTIISNQVQYFFLADYGEVYAPAAAPTIHCFMLPKPIYLYPDDLLSFSIPSWVAGDIVGPVIIHGRFWEIH